MSKLSDFPTYHAPNRWQRAFWAEPIDFSNLLDWTWATSWTLSSHGLIYTPDRTCFGKYLKAGSRALPNLCPHSKNIPTDHHWKAGSSSLSSFLNLRVSVVKFVALQLEKLGTGNHTVHVQILPSHLLALWLCSSSSLYASVFFLIKRWQLWCLSLRFLVDTEYVFTCTVHVQYLLSTQQSIHTFNEHWF